MKVSECAAVTQVLLLFLLAGCVPMVVSIYVPATGEPKERSQCGWSNVSVPLLSETGAEITAVFHGSPSIGLYGLTVRLNDGVALEFSSNELTITSPELTKPVLLRFGMYEHGVVRSVSELKGPTVTSLQVVSASTPRPQAILLAMAEVKVNDVVVRPQPVQLRLRQSGALVGLCQ